MTTDHLNCILHYNRMLPISLQGILYGSLLIGWLCQNHWPDKECSQRNKSESEKSEDKRISHPVPWSFSALHLQLEDRWCHLVKLLVNFLAQKRENLPMHHSNEPINHCSIVLNIVCPDVSNSFKKKFFSIQPNKRIFFFLVVFIHLEILIDVQN